MPGFHSQRPLSRKRVDGQSLIDQEVIGEHSEEMSAASRGLFRYTMRTFWVAVIAGPLCAMTIGSSCMASGLGSDTWVARTLGLCFVLAIVIYLLTKSAYRAIEKAEDVAEINLSVIDEVASRVVSRRYDDEGEVLHVTTSENE